MTDKAMLRQRIIRYDFRRVRKGWDPEQVGEHLAEVASLFEETPGRSLASDATERVGAIVEAAERSAAELEKDARERATAITEEASAEAEKLVSEARAEAGRMAEEAQAKADELIAAGQRQAEERVGAARQAIAELLERTDQLREQVEADQLRPADGDAEDDPDGGRARSGSVAVPDGRVAAQELAV